jgi:hypothetical protein
MFKDRFDLCGKKIVDFTEFKVFLTNNIKKIRLEKLSSIAIDILYQNFIQYITENDFARSSSDCENTELYNHELEQDKPGYNLNEICEVI